MAQRLVGCVRHEVLLRHIGDVLFVGVLSEKMIKGLIFLGPHILGNRTVPLLGFAEGRGHVEDHAAKRVNPMANNLADLELGVAEKHEVTLESRTIRTKGGRLSTPGRAKARTSAGLTT